jgi:hypothetical protein
MCSGLGAVKEVEANVAQEGIQRAEAGRERGARLDSLSECIEKADSSGEESEMRLLRQSMRRR